MHQIVYRYRLSLIFFSIFPVGLLATPPDTALNPNILMICVDDLRPELGCYGASHMITPNIDRLATEGYQFNRAYTQLASCSPSRTSVMTGMRPDSTKVWDIGTHFRDTIPWVETLPQYLSKHGYHSVGIGKIFHYIDSKYGSDNALSWDEPTQTLPAAYYYVLQENIDLRDSFGKGPPTECAAVPDNAYRDGANTDWLIDNLARIKAEGPFFLAVGYMRPHLPFSAPKSYWDLYSTNNLILPSTVGPGLNASLYASTEWSELRGYYGIPATGPVSEAQEQELIHGYYASVSYVDAQIGRLLEVLEAQGLADNTIVVLWGDHGWHLGNKGLWAKYTNFESATRIPLIIKVPWLEGGATTDALVEALDIFPTILDICDIPAAAHLQGDSLNPLLENPSLTGDEYALSQVPRTSDDIMGYSMRTDRYRYTEWRSQNSNFIVDRELYDHSVDSGEDSNVVHSTEYAVAVDELSILLDAHLKELNPHSGTTNDPLIVNYEFDQGFADWKRVVGPAASTLFELESSLDAEGLTNSLVHVVISDGTDKFHNIALKQGFMAQSNKRYTIRFRAHASTNRLIRIACSNKSDGRIGYLYRTVSLDMNHREYEFTNIDLNNLIGDDPNAEIQIQFGTDDVDVWLDSFELFSFTSLSHELLSAGLSGIDAMVTQDGGDSDTVPNIMEYAYNLNLNSNDLHHFNPETGVSGLPHLRVDVTNHQCRIRMEYLRRRGAYDLRYIPEFTNNLLSNQWESAISMELVYPLSDDWEHVIVTDAETADTQSNRFGRVRVEFSP